MNPFSSLNNYIIYHIEFLPFLQSHYDLKVKVNLLTLNLNNKLFPGLQITTVKMFNFWVL